MLNQAAQRRIGSQHPICGEKRDRYDFWGTIRPRKAFASRGTASIRGGRRSPAHPPPADDDQHGLLRHQPGSSLTVEEASELAAGAKRAALAMFPDKELAYDLLYKPRLQRLMRERFRLQ